MAELFDSAGNLIEGALTADEVKAIQEKADGYVKELESVKEKLGKLENKDMNFKKLRDLTEAERQDLSAKDMELMKRQEKLEEDQRNFVDTQINSYKDEALAVLAGNNSDLRKKTEYHYGRLKDEAITREDIRMKMRDAYRLAQSDISGGPDPLTAAAGYSGGYAPSAKPSSAEFDSEQKDLARKLGLSDEDLKKFNK